MKIKAYQVAPEYQEAPALEDMLDNSVIITENSSLEEWKTEAYKTVYNALLYGENPREDGEEGFETWEKLIEDSTQQAISDEKAIRKGLCKGLELITGEKWAYKELRGTSQSDWNGCYYMIDRWTREALDAIEMEYFNTGTAWTLENENGESEGNIYTHHWTDEENRAEIAESVGVDPEDVTLYLFDGWTKTAKYKEV